mmetsp:Transcript_22025/g.46357  ORF Transcript_22025/g.46357 Transcript_22025/m.46357 type:complete len:408 (+) Transcript_22025:1-1224(+)
MGPATAVSTAASSDDDASGTSSSSVSPSATTSTSSFCSSSPNSPSSGSCSEPQSDSHDATIRKAAVHFPIHVDDAMPAMLKESGGWDDGHDRGSDDSRFSSSSTKSLHAKLPSSAVYDKLRTMTAPQRQQIVTEEVQEQEERKDRRLASRKQLDEDVGKDDIHGNSNEEEGDSEDYEYEDDDDDLDPKLWWKFSIWVCYAYFSCNDVFSSMRPIYDSKQWMDLQKFYHEFAAQDLLDKPLKETGTPRTFQHSEESFEAPMISFQAGDKGRGVKASRDIEMGELVYEATNNTVVFSDGHTWRKFLFAIHEKYRDDVDSFTPCEPLMWAWVQALEEEGPLHIFVDLDHSSLMNTGKYEEGQEPPNVSCVKEGGNCVMALYATADIKEGEEILCNYNEFARKDGWDDMGL